MSYPTGQVLSAPVVNGSAQDLFGTHIDYLGVGGYRSVATLADRDAIPTKPTLEYDGLGSGMRRHLMLVAVQETGLIYLLFSSGFQALATDADRLAPLRDNTNWISLASFLKISSAGASASTAIGELPEFVATQDGVQSISLPANCTGVFNINLLDSSTDFCTPIYQKYYSIANTTLTIAANASMKKGDKVSGSYYFTSTATGTGTGTGATTMPAIRQTPVYTVVTAGVQTISITDIHTVISVQVLEIGGYVREIFLNSCSVSPNLLTISGADELKVGDKLICTYY